MNDEQKMQIRLTIAVKCLENGVSDTSTMESILKWVLSQQSGIIPVANFKVVEK